MVTAPEGFARTPRLLRWGWPRWYDLAPEVVLGAGLALFLVMETDAATSALKSARAVTLMATTTIGWLVARGVIARFVPWAPIRLGLFGAASLLALKVVVLPSFQDTTVVEAFPGGATPVTVTAAAPSATVAPAAPSATPAPAPGPAATAATATPEPAATATPTPGPAATAAPGPSPAATAPPAVAPPPAAVEPVRIRVGTFSGIDHRAAGTVALYRQPDGSFVVGLEDIDIQPGPDYDVYLVPGTDRTERDGGTRVDDLRGNKGTQFYAVPAEVLVESGPWTVLVWCQTFGVPIAQATPA